MSGLTVGPRQFNMQLPGQLLQGTSNVGINPYSQTSGGSLGHTYYASVKLDLRGLNAGSDVSRGLNPMSIQLQESGPWSTSDVSESDLGHMICYDIISTVPLNKATIQNIIRYPHTGQDRSVPGFLADADDLPLAIGTIKQQFLNSSQVIWGRWRQGFNSREYGLGTERAGFRWGQSGTFGSGEIMVSNDAYYTRIVGTAVDGQTVLAPSVNLAVWAEVLSLTEGQELTQLSRMVQR